MSGHLRTYVTAITSAKNYVAQWSADHVYANESLIVPFPTLAIFDPYRNVWSIHIKAWLYLPFGGKKIKSYLPSLPRFFRGKTEEAPIEQEQEQEEEEESIDNDDMYEDALEELNESNENPGRLGLFFVKHSVKVVTKSIINGVEYLLQPSDESGFIEEQLELSDDEIQSLCTTTHTESNDRKFEYELKINESKTEENYKTFKCTIYVLACFGVSIISDIDDTIKISQVRNKGALLKHTFYNYFKPVDGMNELYQEWFKQKCQFHYVSSSPWQLYPALRSFLEKYQYPIGTMNLRKFAWNFKFLKPPDTYKIETITQIIKSYPGRKCICVGDSGELDPEIYSKLFSIYPQNIAHIFIRDVCAIPECLPICQQRYEKAFKDIPIERWTVFKYAKDVPTNIDNLVSSYERF